MEKTGDCLVKGENQSSGTIANKREDGSSTIVRYFSALFKQLEFEDIFSEKQNCFNVLQYSSIVTHKRFEKLLCVVRKEQNNSTFEN